MLCLLLRIIILDRSSTIEYITIIKIGNLYSCMFSMCKMHYVIMKSDMTFIFRFIHCFYQFVFTKEWWHGCLLIFRSENFKHFWAAFPYMQILICCGVGWVLDISFGWIPTVLINVSIALLSQMCRFLSMAVQWPA